MSPPTEMEKVENYSRRKFLAMLPNAVLLIIGANVLAGCRNKQSAETHPQQPGPAVTSCDDLSHVSDEDIKVRKKLGYVEESPLAENRCNNCNLYLPPKADEKCGGCMLFKGPVFSEAYCTYWAPKV